MAHFKHYYIIKKNQTKPKIKHWTKPQTICYFYNILEVDVFSDSSAPQVRTRELNHYIKCYPGSR